MKAFFSSKIVALVFAVFFAVFPFCKNVNAEATKEISAEDVIEALKNNADDAVKALMEIVKDTLQHGVQVGETTIALNNNKLTASQNVNGVSAGFACSEIITHLGTLIGPGVGYKHFSTDDFKVGLTVNELAFEGSIDQSKSQISFAVEGLLTDINTSINARGDYHNRVGPECRWEDSVCKSGCLTSFPPGCVPVGKVCGKFPLQYPCVECTYPLDACLNRCGSLTKLVCQPLSENSCSYAGSEHFDIDIALDIALDLRTNLRHSFSEDEMGRGVIVLSKGDGDFLSGSAQVSLKTIEFESDFGWVSPTQFGVKLRLELESLFELVDSDDSLENQAEKSINGAIGKANEEFENNVLPIKIVLPELSDTIITQISLLSNFKGDYLSPQCLKQGANRLMYHALTGNTDALGQVENEIRQCSKQDPDGKTTIICNAIDLYKDLAIDLYALQDGTCVQISPVDRYDTYFGDSSCGQTISYEPTDINQYCHNHLTGGSPHTRHYLGNPKAWERAKEAAPLVGTDDGMSDHLKWTAAYGPTADILALPIDEEAKMPFVKQVEYRKVSHASTEEKCSLEMRIFKNNPLDNNLKPLMFFHGGAWTNRGAALVGGEALYTHLLNKGYIVFAPTYRLLSDADGPLECRNAKGQDILDDITAAFEWVKANGSVLGADPNKQIAVVGQSAGAHLAGYLAVHKKGEVGKALMIYPPTDFNHLISENDGLYDGMFGDSKETIADFIHEDDGAGGIVPINYIDPANQVVINNSFPQIIKDYSLDDLVNSADFFVIHGNADDVVPVEQSSRLCESLADEDFDTTLINASVVKSCDRNDFTSRNQLYIIDGAAHALDLRCIDSQLFIDTNPAFEIIAPYIPTSCYSGSKAGEMSVNMALQGAMDWLENENHTVVIENETITTQQVIMADSITIKPETAITPDSGTINFIIK